MKHLIKYSIFENTTRTRSTPTSGSFPRINTDDLSFATGKSVDKKNKGKVDEYMSNWFQRLGSKIEELGGTLIKDPGQWRRDYVSKLPSRTVKMAGGNTIQIDTNAGFSDIVGAGVSLIKGILEKMFGGPTAPPLESDNPTITPQHERIFVDRHRSEYSTFRTQEDMDKWIMNNYKVVGYSPGQNSGFDRAMQAAELDWLRGSGGTTAIRSASAAEVGTVAGAGASGGMGRLAGLAI